MRRGRRIVNEMEFRMLCARKSFSPSTRVETMKGFLERIFADALACAARRRSLCCFNFAHLRLRTPRILESGSALKRHCSMRAQYGRPFH
jgi:hypothetical protein